MEPSAKSTVILLIYIDSMVFIMGSAILAHGFGVDSSKATCTQAVVLCLACYMTTKVFIYYFLVERAFIIRRTTKPRMKDKLYLFNSFGMLCESSGRRVGCQLTII